MMGMTAHAIASFYEDGREDERLARGIGRLEAVRTLELLSRYLPPSPATVYDVGGATGYHARWLGERGYAVHLLDAVPAHVDRARQNAPRLASAHVGDARQLPWANESADVVLLMGPLYHLTERADRVRALSEARRVLRRGGMVFGVIIPRWASTFVGMQRGWVYDDAYATMVRDEIATGRHARPAAWPQLFMDGYFHSLEDLDAEIAGAKMTLRSCISIEGPAWMSDDFDAAWDDPRRRERILEVARLAENALEVLAMSPHVAFISGVP
jgi:SAM-dependent methyltransferase